ncbi:MAG: universal stress protein [Cytophagales bacterium]|nr:universal stress protein [Bernardetiaceae bacterium]MDW8209817.1 universal stress protein [Cytophagales bacterium]
MKIILVPTDFSENALKAMEYAIHLAQLLKSHLVFFRATDTIIPETAPVHLYHELVKNDIEENMEELRKNVAQAYADAGVTPTEGSYSLDVKYGAFKDMVHLAIQEHKADMIVMGTQGASGLKKVFFGSNTANLVTRVDIPLLAVVPYNVPTQAVEKIGYASDLTDLSEELGKIIDFARPFNATVEIFHVYPVDPPLIDVSKFDKEKVLQQLKKHFDYDKIDILFIQTEQANDISEGIEQYVKEHRPSLLAMFAHERTWFEKIFNPSISQEIAMRAIIPLLVFKK